MTRWNYSISSRPTYQELAAKHHRWLTEQSLRQKIQLPNITEPPRQPAKMPPSLDDFMLNRARKLWRKGFDTTEIAKHLSVSIQTTVPESFVWGLVDKLRDVA